MTTSRSKVTLRPYQTAALQAIQHGFGEYQRQLAILPTGAGKTVVLAHLAAAYQPRRSLVLAHREELIVQAVDKIRTVTGLHADIEMGEGRASRHAPVVVASVQTLSRQTRRDRWPRDHFGLVVVDEAHHTLAESYLGTLRWFGDKAFVLGVTATPDRGDKRNLGRYYENIAYEVTLLDLIKEKWLAPIRVKTVPLEIDLNAVRSSGGDYMADDLSHALEPYLTRIVDVIEEHRDRKMLVFLPLVAISKTFTRLCCERGLLAEHVDGASPDRREILARFSRGESRNLSNAMLLTEGYDEPSIDCVVCLRPTKARALYSQIVGRGTRLYPGKDHLLLLDFLWQSEEHHLVKPAHLVSHDPDEAERITKALGSDGDLDEAKTQADADRSATLRQRLHQNARRASRTFDAVEFALSLGDLELGDFIPTMTWHAQRATLRQQATLKQFGFNPDSVTCRGQAAALLDKLLLRRELNLATPKQLMWLRRLAHPAPELATFDEARVFLDLHWKKGGVPA